MTRNQQTPEGHSTIPHHASSIYDSFLLEYALLERRWPLLYSTADGLMPRILCIWGNADATAM